MKILLIQLSDIHFALGANTLLSKQEKLQNTLTHQTLLADKVFICVTGDSVFSGTSSEYNIAHKFITNLHSNLSQEFNTRKIDIVIIPGNHDCDFSHESNTVREAILKSIYSDSSTIEDSKIIDICTSVQENFFEYNNTTATISSKLEKNNCIWSSKVRLSDKHSIVFNCYNTALMSTLKEKQGSLLFPVDKLNTPKLEEQEASIIVSLLHHPKSWFAANNARAFYQKIEATSDIALTGHEHIHSTSLRDDLDGNNFLYIEGGVLQDSQSASNSSFNTILIDLDNEKINITNYKWDGKTFKEAITKEAIDYKERLGKFKQLYDFSKNHTDWLTDPGANYSHPNKNKLYLTDIFVFPNFREVLKSSSDKDGVSQRLFTSSESIINSLQKGFKILISGSENSGKTTIAKVLIRKILSLDLIPIYIEGHQIKKTDFSKFYTLLKRAFEKQYNDRVSGTFNSIPITKFAIIIDDFDKTQLNTSHKNKLLDVINQKIENIIIIGNEVLSIEEIAENNSHIQDSVLKFKHYEIAEQGYQLRYKLINQWNTLGTTEHISNEDLIRKNENAERIINGIIGPNLIPAYPVFLLTILQTIEAGNSHDLKESSYGHYYQVLITGTLNKNVKSDKIEAYYTYLSSLANHFYEEKAKELTIDNLRIFHKKHSERYMMSYISFDEIMQNLKSSQMLEENDYSLSFKYKYIFYYFAAKYLAENLYKSEIKERVKSLCRMLHRDYAANIILFLTHHTKDIFIIEEILSVAKKQFEDQRPATLQDDITALNNTILEAPKLFLNNKSNTQHKKEILEKKDTENTTLEDISNTKVEFDDEDQNIDALDISAKLNTAFKTLEIAGQILKNHHAKFEANEKIALAEESYFIGLRVLSLFFEVYTSSSDFIEGRIRQVLEKEPKNDNSKIQSIAKKIVFHIATSTTHSVLRKTSMAVGNEYLKDVFEKVKEKNDTNAVALIDFQINTEYYNNLPVNYLEKLKKKFEKNYMTTTLLRYIVLDYLYLYPTSVARKQQICNIIGISMQTQRYVAATSMESKK